MINRCGAFVSGAAAALWGARHDLAFLAGLAAFVTGAWWVNPAIAMGLGGLIVMALAVAARMTARREQKHGTR